MGGVFISYRGEDSETAAVLIDRELVARFGGDRVFFDNRSIPAGVDFVEELLARLRACSVLLVVIGPRWLTLTDAAGERRIDDHRDWIRREIVEAFSHGLRVVPVLTDDVRLPLEADLPDDIAGLSRRQYVPLRRRYAAVDLAFLADRITDTDPELAKTALAPRPGVGRVPQQLPAAVPHFTGRAGELAALTELLHVRTSTDTGGTVVISAVCGMPGVGKSALAMHWAHQMRERFPDGQLYVNLRGFGPSEQVMAPAEAVRRFLDALDVPAERIPVDLDAQTALYRSQLAGKRMLVMLDNARDSSQIRPLLPGTPTSLVLVTSRNQLTCLVAAVGACTVTLDLLTDDEARQLLARRLGADRVAAEPAAVAEIIAHCARLPLALAMVAARAAMRPHGGLRHLAGELRDSQHRWEALSGDDPTMDVRAVFSWSYRALTPPAARLLRLLGLHPGPDLTMPAAASLAGITVSEVRPVLAELIRASLLVEYSLGRYAFHDLLRGYATELTHAIDSDQQRRAATRRMLDHYLHTAHTAERLIYPARDPITPIAPQPGATPEHFTDYQQALAWLTTERSVLLAAVDQAAAAGLDTHTWQLALALWVFLDRRGEWHDCAAAGRAAVAAADRLADPSAQARANRLLADAYTWLGRFDEAYARLSRGLNLAIQTGDQALQAHVHFTLSIFWLRRRCDYERGLDHARQALDLYQAVGHPAWQAEALTQVGRYHALLGDYRQTLTACRQALKVHQDLDNLEFQAYTWHSLGHAHHHLGHHAQAITCYQEGLTLAQDLGVRHLEGRVLTQLGDAHHATGNPQVARDLWRQALTILDALSLHDTDQVRVKLAALDPVDGRHHHG